MSTRELVLMEGFWISERMTPGTFKFLERFRWDPDQDENNPYVAILSCLTCGTVGQITKYQYCGFESVICGGDDCSAEYFFEKQFEDVARDPVIFYRLPQ
jgi:hypothetical protein